MRSSKSRSRGKNRNNNNRSMGNVVNRVFDSSGPEGKVRGTPQQIIEKYQALHRDAQLSNDRVAAENFAQHAEHYARMLGEAQREQEARREAQEAQQREREAQREQNREAQQNQNQPSAQNGGSDAAQPEVKETSQNQQRDTQDRRRNGGAPSDAGQGEQPDVIDFSEGSDSGLVETVETAPKPKRGRTRKPKTDPVDQSGEADEKPAAE